MGKATEEQKEIIFTKDGNMAVIATAGSGKTTVLVNRIKYLLHEQVKPESILAVTFSRKSMETLRERVGGITRQSVAKKINIHTFHSFAKKIIDNSSGVRYKLLDNTYERNKIIDTYVYSMGIFARGSSHIPYTDIRKGFSHLANNMPLPDNLFCSEKQFRQLYASYQKAKFGMGYYEFDDMLPMAVHILKTDQQALQKYQRMAQYVLVDEYQDVSENQAEFLYLLNQNNTMIVGDSLQAIYGFRGGSSKFILDFDQRYPDVKVYHLNKNFRCSGTIVDAANHFATHLPDSNHKYYKSAVSQNEQGDAIAFVAHQNIFEEAKFVVNELISCQQLRKSALVLTRTNAQLHIIEAYCNACGVSFTVSGGGYLTDTPEIKLLINYLKLAADKTDDDAFRYVVNKPWRHLNKMIVMWIEQRANAQQCCLFDAMDYVVNHQYIAAAKTGAEDLKRIIKFLKTKKCKTLGEKIAWLRNELPIDQFFDNGQSGDSEQWNMATENMDMFKELCDQYTDISDLLNDIERKTMESNTILLSTIHRAKGLEADVCIIVGCNDGMMPHHRAEDLESERKLMYVAITRAKKQLVISYPNVGTFAYALGPSSYIKEIKEATNAFGENQDRKIV